MASENDENNVRIWIFLLIVFSHVLTNKYVNGRKISTSMTTNYTIQGENGDVIDCVDIFKQPAFSHPLLKNHTLQKRPSLYPIGITKGNKDELFHGWKKNVQCPKGTIPILRTTLFNYRKTAPIFPDRTLSDANVNFAHEYAVYSVEGGPYYGSQAKFNVWNPETFDGEFSLSQLWVIAGQDQSRNTIEAGWHVYPFINEGSNKPRLFIYWTSDNYQRTGCYNLKCEGFVQTNPRVPIGADIGTVSTYDGTQYFIPITVFKDKQSGNWWLRVEDEDLGYWPAAIFTTLAESSTKVQWGGEITNSETNGRHTSTQMGSGHFPSEGYGKAAVITNLGFVDNSGAIIDPEQFTPIVIPKPPCYDMMVGEKGQNGFGVHFYFGGPGFSPQCP